MTRRHLLWLAGLALAVALVFALWPPALQREPEPALMGLTLAPGCDPTAAACTARGEGIELTLTMGPDVAVMQPFPVEVTLAGAAVADVRRVEADFGMPGMNMGMNTYRLARDDDGVWRARPTLPVCQSGRRDWRLTLTLYADGQGWRLVTPFVAAGR